MAENDDGGLGSNFRIERQVQAGTYYVEVRGFRPSRTGSYELRVSAADDTPGGGETTTFGSGDTISSLPSGNWFPDVTSGGSFSSSGGNVTVQLNNGGYIEVGNYRYTCQSVGGCTVRNRQVQSGMIVQTSKGAAPGDGGGETGAAAPDLVVESARTSDATPDVGASFTLRATVRNRGDARSAATTLRYYRSTNATISRSDTQVGTDAVSGLPASGTSAESISLAAPSSAGTYYYGACVDSVAGESDTDNNCSAGVRVSVTGGGDPTGGACRAGLVVNPGGSCTYKGSTFRVSSSGRGSIAFFSAGTSIDTRGSTINGVRWNFYASKNSGGNSWTIHVAD